MNLSQVSVNDEPFKHAIIKNAFNEELMQGLHDYFDKKRNDKSSWKSYNNPLEKKLVYDENLFDNPTIKQIINHARSPEVLTFLRKTFNISEEIELDEDLYGAGLHNHERGQLLCTHLDYEINPVSYKKRYINMILYVNKEWSEEYNGDTEMWNTDITECKRVYPEYNKALFFKTDGESWHGVSKPIRCPETLSRRTLALYYVSKNPHTQEKITPETRFKARFYNPKYEELCKIRAIRRLTDDDIQKYT
tara:strand:- start:141 stop:887 length:747 start_codon:yes stop_codon:yes gene_type:complete